jgi:hypothetical protein
MTKATIANIYSSYPDYQDVFDVVTAAINAFQSETGIV